VESRGLAAFDEEVALAIICCSRKALSTSSNGVLTELDGAPLKPRVLARLLVDAAGVVGAMATCEELHNLASKSAARSSVYLAAANSIKRVVGLPATEALS